MKRSSWSAFETIAMRDTKLEAKLRLVALQLENWKKLHDLITYGLDKAKPIISTEQERQFTEIRANLLQEIEYVLRELKYSGGGLGQSDECFAARCVRPWRPRSFK